MPIVALDNFLEDEPPLLFGLVPLIDCLELGVFDVDVLVLFGLAVPGFHIIVMKVAVIVRATR